MCMHPVGNVMDTSFYTTTHSSISGLHSWDLVICRALCRVPTASVQGWLNRIWGASYVCHSSVSMQFVPMRRSHIVFTSSCFFQGSVPTWWLSVKPITHDELERAYLWVLGCAVFWAVLCYSMLCCGAGLCWEGGHVCGVSWSLPVLYHPKGSRPGGLLGKEGYHQRTRLISIKRTLFPN